MSTDEAERYPGIAQAIRLLLLFLLLALVFGGVLGLVGGIIGSPLHEQPEALAAVNLAAAVCVFRRGLRKAKAPFAQVFPFTRFRLSLLVPMSLTVIAAFALLSEMDNLLRTVLPMPSWCSDFFSDLVGGQTSLWGSAVLLVVVAPLTEELLFRGLILRGFLSRYTTRKAVVASALLFATAHLNPWQMPAAMVLGLLLAWWFLRTGSLLPCLFGHALLNAVPLLLNAVLHVEIRGLTGSPSGEVAFQPFWLDVAAAVVAGIGLWLLVRMFKGEAKAPAGGVV